MKLFVLSLLVLSAAEASDTSLLQREEIRIRDPYVLWVEEEATYYLYGTGSPLGELGFDAYASKDLQHWEGPFPVFRAPEGFWGTKHFWAPEVHRYQGKYYLFGTFAKDDPLFRATQICVSDSPRGPFVPLGDAAQTPADWLSLDGTLFIDADNQPWMVFCHEWVQVGDGEMNAVRLSEDLSQPIGEAILLFRASEAPWNKEYTGVKKKGVVTDGPCLYRHSNGNLMMLWSSFGHDSKYKVGIAHSKSGSLQGPWVQEDKPIFEADGGHPMLFKGLDGQLMMSIHSPNRNPERPLFLPLQESKTSLIRVNE